MPASLANITTLSADGSTVPSEELPSSPRVCDAVIELLEGTPLAAWSTVAEECTPHINIGYFAYSADLHLYLLSHPGSQHGRNVAANPAMAVAVFPSAQEWTGADRGVQLFGRCFVIDAADEASAVNAYTLRFPAYASWRSGLRPDDPARASRFYRFTPDRLKILDEAAFGEAVFVTADVIRAA